MIYLRLLFFVAVLTSSSSRIFVEFLQHIEKPFTYRILKIMKWNACLFIYYRKNKKPHKMINANHGIKVNHKKENIFLLLKNKILFDMSEKSLSIIQHDIYHSLHYLISVVTIVSSMLLVNRLKVCKPVDNSHENLLNVINALCWVAIAIMFVKAFVAGTQYTQDVVIDHCCKPMQGLNVAMHVVVVVIAILVLTYLSKTNIHKCSNTSNMLNQVAINDINPINTNSLVTWVVVLSVLVLLCSFKHLLWMIGSKNPVKHSAVEGGVKAARESAKRQSARR